MQVHNQKCFEAVRVFVELGHFSKHLVKNTRNRDPKGDILEFFLLDTLKTTFSKENLTQDGQNQGLSFQNQDTFPNFQKVQGGLLSPPSCALVSVAEYAPISLNIPKYP